MMIFTAITKAEELMDNTEGPGHFPFISKSQMKNEAVVIPAYTKGQVLEEVGRGFVLVS